MSLLLTVWDDGADHEASDQFLGEVLLDLVAWSDHEASDQFLGEVLLDLALMDVRGSVVWFDLQEHDLNCTSAPTPSPKFSRSALGGVLHGSRSVSRQSSRDSSVGRNTASPDATGTSYSNTTVYYGIHEHSECIP